MNEWVLPFKCESGACVEVKHSPCGSGNCDEWEVRNSNNPNTVVKFSNDEWATFIEAVKNGQYDIYA